MRGVSEIGDTAIKRLQQKDAFIQKHTDTVEGVLQNLNKMMLYGKGTYRSSLPYGIWELLFRYWGSLYLIKVSYEDNLSGIPSLRMSLKRNGSPYFTDQTCVVEPSDIMREKLEPILTKMVGRATGM